MARKQTLLLHACAVNRVSYGLGFTAVFIAGSVSEHLGDFPDEGAELAVCARLLFCLGMVLSVHGYFPLFKLDYCDTPRTRDFALAGLIGLFPLALVFMGFWFGGQGLWRALAGA